MSAAQTMASLAEGARKTEQAERERLDGVASASHTSTSVGPAIESHPKTVVTSAPAEVSVEGRVFHRLQRFQLLPSELKAQSDMVATYLLAPGVRQRVFVQQMHWWHHPFRSIKMKTTIGPTVQGRKLLKFILEYLLLSHAANNTLRDAEQLAEGLVLSGFLSPVNEAPEDNDESLGELYVQDGDYYELVAPGATVVVPRPNVVVSATVGSSATGSVPGAIVSPIQTQHSPTSNSEQPRHDTTLSVWAATDGATRASFVQRRLKRSHVRNLLSVVPKMRRCYAVVNKTKHHALLLFENDVARHELKQVLLSSATVEYHTAADGDASCHSLKIDSDDETVEILNFPSKAEQERWLLALLDAGATFLETHLAILSFAASTASLFSLHDRYATGRPFCLSTLRGQVALLTNVPNSACDDGVGQLEELVELSMKYESDGFQVVAFPSTQFGDAEFDSDEKLADHFQQTFGVFFPVLVTRDVNGPNARDALLFLKTRLPGAGNSAAHSFIEGDFVKFLVDRDGRPSKRYGPSVLPCSIESDIQRLL